MEDGATIELAPIEQRYRLGDLTIDVARREVARAGTKIALPGLSFDLLLALVRAAPNLVTYEELMARVWPGVVVSPETVTQRVKLVRDALGDDPKAPRYIVGVRGRGYRVETAAPAGAAIADASIERTTEPQAIAPARARKLRLARFVLAGCLAALLAAVAVWQAISGTPEITGYRQITLSKDWFSPYWSPIPLVTDGTSIYFNEWAYFDQHEGRQVPVTGGESSALPIPVDADEIGEVEGISPGGDLLVWRYPRTNFQIGTSWLWPGGPELRRLGTIDALVGGWSGDGKRLVASIGPDLYVANADGNESKKVLTVDGKIYWPRMSPDGLRVRFSIRKPGGYFLSLWEVNADGTNLHQMLEGWNQPADECCGSWTPDGEYYVFQATRDGVSHIWAMRDGRSLFGAGDDEPVQLTSGPMNMIRPTISPDGHRLFAIGVHPRAHLRRYDRASGAFVADVLEGRSAEWLSFSRDGEWVSYSTFPDATLWRSRRDGSQSMQLTRAPMRVTGSTWSPDGRTLAFAALTPEGGVKVHLVDTDGASAPRPLTKVQRLEGAMAWSPDGESVAFGTPDGIRIADVATGSERGLDAPEPYIGVSWSPDGRYITAISAADRERIMCFDFTTREWRELQRVPNAMYMRWSPDSEYVYVMTRNTVSVFRIRVSDRSLEQIGSAEREKWVFSAVGPWVGVTPEGDLLYLHEDGVQRIYAMDWNL